MHLNLARASIGYANHFSKSGGEGDETRESWRKAHSPIIRNFSSRASLRGSRRQLLDVPLWNITKQLYVTMLIASGARLADEIDLSDMASSGSPGSSFVFYSVACQDIYPQTP